MKDKEHPTVQKGEAGRRGSSSDAGTGYLYIVKNPASRETGVFAFDSIIYGGTSVVVPTKYGQDLGQVLGPLSLDDSYRPGCPHCQGACLGSADEYGQLQEEEEPEAWGEPEDTTIMDTARKEYEASARESVIPPVVETPRELTPMEKAGVSWSDKPDAHACSSCTACAKHREPVLGTVEGDVDWIDHLATPSEMKRYKELEAKEQDALRICREKVRKLGLDMKTVAAHYLLGEPKLLFFFTSDVRVDFRLLVKELVAIFRLRIELRQIGVRDEARVVGGLAVCGREYCCHAVSDNLQTVSIKMAKEQNLSLNSMKISGPCGRLLCCLAYENDFYEEARQEFPPVGSRLKLDQDLMRVTDINVLSRKISLSGAEGRFLVVPASAVYYDGSTSRWEVTREFQETLSSDA